MRVWQFDEFFFGILTTVCLINSVQIFQKSTFTSCLLQQFMANQIVHFSKNAFWRHQILKRFAIQNTRKLAFFPNNCLRHVSVPRWGRGGGRAQFSILVAKFFQRATIWYNFKTSVFG